MHLPPRTCPVRRISGDLRSSDPRGCAAGGRPATCDLRPACYCASLSRVWAEVLFSRWARLLWLRLALRSWQHAIHGRISVFGDGDEANTHKVVSEEKRENETTLPANPLPALGVWPLPRLRPRSRSRFPAPRYPLGMPLGIDRSMPVGHARQPVQARRQVSTCACSQDEPSRQGPLACDLLLMTDEKATRTG